MTTFTATAKLTEYKWTGTETTTRSKTMQARSYNKVMNTLLDEIEEEERAKVRQGKISNYAIAVL